MTDKTEMHTAERTFIASDWSEEFTHDDGTTYLVIHHSKFLDDRRAKQAFVLQDAYNWA